MHRNSLIGICSVDGAFQRRFSVQHFFFLFPVCSRIFQCLLFIRSVDSVGSLHRSLFSGILAVQRHDMYPHGYIDRLSSEHSASLSLP